MRSKNQLLFREIAVDLSGHRWWIFWFFLLVNTYLSYGPASLLKLWVGVFGGALPFLCLLLLSRAQRRGSPPLFQKELYRGSTAWPLALLLGLGVFLRLFRFQSLSIWPLWDDGYISSFAVDLVQKWHWRLLFGWMHDPPLYTWIQSLYFRLLEPSIRSVWLYPILYSVLALPLAYAAVRKYGSRSFSLAYLGFLALGFWPILVSRFSIDIELCLVWEYLALAAFSSIWRAWDSPRGPGAAQACFLGLVTGLGWYTSKFWLPCLGLAVVTIGAYGWGRPKAQGMRWWSLFMGSLFLCVSPLLAALASQDFFSHLHSIFVLQPHADPITPQPFFTLSYLTAPFWGIPDYPFFTFGPFLGGFFNPLVTTLFWLGLLELFSSRRARGRWAVLLVGVFFFAPLLFTQSLEVIRICIALPFLLFPVAMGFQTLLAGMKAPGQKWACGAIFGLSLALDMFHLWVGYGAWAVPENTQGRSKSALAYQVDGILRKAQHPPGPGLIMTDFIPDAFDQTLRAGTYGLNALIDPAWSPRQATWACVWVRREYEDYLRRLFPGSRVYRLERVETLENGATSLFLIPINDQNRPLLLRWGKFHEALRPIYGMGHPHDPAKARYALSRLYPLVKNDPFLRSIFWWKWVCLADFQPDYIDNQDVLEKFIIPQAREPFWRTLISYTYYNLGMCYGTRRDLKDARLMLAKANLYDPQLVPLQAEAKAMAYMVLKLGGTPPSPALP